jgi:hypothetical protein
MRRPLLSWKISAAVPPLCWVLACAALTYQRPLLAKVLFLATGLLSLAHYLLSDSIVQSSINLERTRKEAEKDISRLRKGLAYKQARFWHYGRPIAVVASSLLATALGLHWVISAQRAVELSRLEGRLYPANEPTPQNPCQNSVKEGQVVVLLGADAVLADTFPVSILSVEGKDRLVLDRQEDGSIAVSIDILRDDGGVLVKIAKGEFVIPDSPLHKQRKDRNTLQVTDPSRTQVLIMRFINDQTLLIDAVLRYPGLENPIIFSGSDAASAKVRSTEFKKEGTCNRNTGLSLEPPPQTVFQQE